VRAKEFLSQRGVSYIEKDVSRDRQAAMEMIRLSGQQGVPVIAVDDQVVVGFNRPRLEALLAGRPGGAAGGRKALGARVADAATMALRLPDLPRAGAYVGGVRAGSPAEQAGLRAGDVILRVGGRSVADAAGLEQAVQAAPAGAPVPIEYQRAGRVRSATLTL
jgi:glutaredoxin 3